MVETISGSIGAASAFQLTEEIDAFDKQSKKLFRYKEVLAVILQGTVDEYKGYSKDEIMGFIEENSITEETEVSGGRTNARIDGENTEFAELGEKTSFFDVLFKAKNPKLSNGEVMVNLHINVEPQKDYRPGYPIEKRGIYYLARGISSQLDVVTEETDYGQLEKCYSIWICRDRIPEKERMSISFYRFLNEENIGNCQPREEDFDLMTMVILRLGESENDEKEPDVLHFLNLILYPHKKGFREKISDYIDFTECFEKEESQMFSLGTCIYEDGVAEGIKRGIAKGEERGIKALILDNLEENVSREHILKKLQKRFLLTEEDAETYYEKYAICNIEE